MAKKEDCKNSMNEIRILKLLSKKKKENKKAEDKSYTIDIIDNFQLMTPTKKGQELLTYIVLEYIPNKTLFSYFMEIEKTIKFQKNMLN